ncbi:Hypothetical predicted protein [Olea europaea subsp. europaea]|uniref:Uncharacterized protein n=1 Tax=Olea europaea subsp. europaea TaxID=158383 RepID=A0A8S0RER5_OLEEU|nr:Hypothetical predicted protein [Olea europaea subsp. europaea]
MRALAPPSNLAVPIGLRGTRRSCQHPILSQQSSSPPRGPARWLRRRANELPLDLRGCEHGRLTCSEEVDEDRRQPTRARVTLVRVSRGETKEGDRETSAGLPGVPTSA